MQWMSARSYARGAGGAARWAWRERRLTLGLALALLLAAPLTAAEPQPQMTGDLQIHDPSVIEIGGRFVAVGTGQQGRTHGAIRVKISPDGIRWTDSGLIGEGPPAPPLRLVAIPNMGLT